MNQEKIGKFIAENRKKKNLTQEQLAEKLNISKNAVSKWKRGICLMDMSLLKPLSEILEIRVIDILSGEIVKENEKESKYEELFLKIFEQMNLKKCKLEKQFYLISIINFLIAIMFIFLSNQAIITRLAIILFVIINSLNLAFYTLSKDIANVKSIGIEEKNNEVNRNEKG